MQPEAKAVRWKEYFVKLLNYAIPDHPISHTKYQRAKPHIENLTLEEIEAAILKLKIWKCSGSDDMAAELIRYGEKEVHKAIYKVCQKIWNEEQMPEEWKEANVIPLYKKGDKMDYNNYRSIVLLDSVYKIFSKILLTHLELYIKGCLWNYQCGFRKGSWLP